MSDETIAAHVALVTGIEAINSALRRFEEEGVHLTDCTESPAAFEQVRRALLDVVRWALDELEGAGVLPTDRRQLNLLEGR